MEQEPIHPGAWTAYELQAVALGDQRLNWRLLETAAKLAAQPSASLNQACADWATSKAAYRLFANAKTTAAKILAPHQSRTQERMAAYARCLAIQDTTLLDYTHHPATQGLGPIGTQQQQLQGLVVHSVLVTTVTGLPLGLLSQQVWARPTHPLPAHAMHKRPLEAKESYKWLVALQESVKHTPVQTQLITVGDREADLFELFTTARELETDLLIRASQNRCVCAPTVGLLWPVLEKQAVAGHLTVQVAQRQDQPARTACVAVRYCALSLKPPQTLPAQLDPVSLYGLLVQEVDPPPDVSPLSWLLLTTVPVRTFDEAVECVAWYCLRWQIEILHKILKSGCRIEAAQLTSAARLKPLLTLYTIIAWRLFWLTFRTRVEPDAPATTILAPHELQALYTFLHKQPLPPTVTPTVRQATHWLAQLGGFLARTGDGEPGVTVIWRGWQRLTDIAAAYLVFQPPPTYG